MSIINFLSKWISSVVVMFIFISFLEIILPNSNMKKYINMIIGLLIIIILINPFIKLISKDIDIERNIFLNMNKMDNMQLENSENKDFICSQNEQIIDVYKSKLERQMSELIESNTKYLVCQVDLQIEEESDDNYGDIKKIVLIIEEKNEKSENDLNNIKTIQVNEIQDVNIGEENCLGGNNEVSENVIEEKVDKQISNILHKNFNVSKEDIIVYLKSKNGR